MQTGEQYTLTDLVQATKQEMEERPASNCQALLENKFRIRF